MTIEDISSPLDINGENRIRSFKGHKKAVVSFNFHNNQIVSSADDFTIKLWDKKSGKSIETYPVVRVSVHNFW